MPCESTYKNSQTITVCARASRLSLIQVNEVLLDIQKHYPHINFNLTTFSSPGDKDLFTPLTSSDVPEDFFTKNLDEYIIEGKYQIAIHSAKDVPRSLSPQLEIVALTKSISAIDCLLFCNDTLPSPSNSQIIIGTSSLRRIRTIQKLFPYWQNKSIRGSIEERINLIHKKTVHGIVIAKAALIRLNLLSKYTIIDLPPPYSPLQGSLMVIAKYNSFDIKKIFSKIHTGNESFFSRLK